MADPRPRAPSAEAPAPGAPAPAIAAPSGAAGDPGPLPFRVVLGYAAGQLGASVLPLLVITWMMPLYASAEPGRAALLSPALLGNLRMFERLFGIPFEPYVGFLSDRWRTRWGRRLPWIALGLPLLVGSFVALWFPPAASTTDDPRVVLHAAVALIVFYASYTVVVAPYSALLPELSPRERERVRLSVWLSVFDVTANVGGALGAGVLVSLGARSFAGMTLANGYQTLGLAAGALALLGFLPVLGCAREPVGEESRPVQVSLVSALRASFSNPGFVPYAACIFGFRFATNAAIIGLPYVATVLMGSDEAGAGMMQATIVGVAALSFPVIQRLVERHGPARVFRWAGLAYVLVLPGLGAIGLVPGVSPGVHGFALFALAGFSTGAVFVIPRTLLAEVIDLDAARTGLRREGMYTGMSGVAEKLGEALAMGATGYLFQYLGSTADRPLGVRMVGAAAALGLGLGLVGFRRYPRAVGGRDR